MNDPKDQPIDNEEQRAWLAEHKDVTGYSWKQLGGRVGIAHQTLGLFVGNNYKASYESIARIAEAVFRYRQMLAAQKALKVELPEIPTYFETDTSQRLIQLLNWAQRGRISAAALSPGMSKTETAKHFRACNSNVVLLTATPSTSKLTNMMNGLINEIGRSASYNFRAVAMSKVIVDHFKNLGNPLLIVDEAQHLDVMSIEQIRSWHDSIGLGVALLGNAGLLQLLEGGSRSMARAQLFSRLSLTLERVRPTTADVDALIDAWGLRDEKLCELVHAIAQKPGALRNATFALELAHMIASSAREELAARHLQDAWTQLSRRALAA